MLLPFLLLSMSSLCWCAEGDAPVLDDHLIAVVNNASGSTWVAARSPRFEGMTIAQAKHMMGTILDPPADMLPNLPTVSWDEEVSNGTLKIPTSFDARTGFPGCIGPILDQAECGSCWAFGAVETLSDRLCISQAARGRNANFTQLAPLDMVSCEGLEFKLFNHGCQGGVPSMAMHYATTSGLVTEACLPYLTSEGGPVPTCGAAKEPCLNFVKTPHCPKTCKDGSSKESAKHKPAHAYSVGGGYNTMAAELMKNGPFEVGMTVFQDFVHYSGGVYKNTGSGQSLGGHAIKIIGWGTDPTGGDYWLVQNSWTTSWGEKGLFRITRGDGDCGIGDGGSAASW